MPGMSCPVEGRDKLSPGEIATMALLVIAALAVRFYFVSDYKVISADGTGYADAARTLLRGDTSLLARYGFYPVLIAIAKLFVPDLEMAGRCAAIVMGSLLMVPLYLLGRDLFDNRVAVAACVVTLVWPEIRSWSGEVMTQAPYMALSLSGVWLVWRMFQSCSRATAFAAGIVLGLAYVTRTEGFLLALLLPLAPLAAALVVPGRRGDAVRLVAAYAAGFLLVLLPNLYLVHAATGSWQLAFKTSEALKDSLVFYLKIPENQVTPQMQKIGYLGLIRDYPGFVTHTTWENLKLTGKTMVPWALWPLIVIGFAGAGWKQQEVWKRLFLLSTFSPLAVIVVFYYAWPEYLQFYLPVLFLWGAAGLRHLETLLTQAIPGNVRGAMARIPLGLCVALVFAAVILARQVSAAAVLPKEYQYSDDCGRYDQKRLGRLIREHLPPGKIMTRWPRIGFYSEREWVGIPTAELPEIISTARNTGTRFIVVDGQLLTVRPQLGPLFAAIGTQNSGRDFFHVKQENERSFTPVPGVSLYMIYLHPTSNCLAVYEVSP